jgi:hypothetical protein
MEQTGRAHRLTASPFKLSAVMNVFGKFKFVADLIDTLRALRGGDSPHFKKLSAIHFCYAPSPACGARSKEPTPLFP